MSNADGYYTQSFCFLEGAEDESTGLLDQWFEIHPVFFKGSEWKNSKFNKLNNFMATLKYPAFATSERVCSAP